MNNKQKMAIGMGVTFGTIRLFIAPHDATLVDVYKDLVHVFMGVIGATAWQGDKVCKWLFWSLCVLEVSVAVLSRM